MRDRAFSAVWIISVEKLMGYSRKSYLKSPLNFCSHRTPDPDRILLGGGLRSPSAVVVAYLGMSCCRLIKWSGEGVSPGLYDCAVPGIYDNRNLGESYMAFISSLMEQIAHNHPHGQDIVTHADVLLSRVLTQGEFPEGKL